MVWLLLEMITRTQNESCGKLSWQVFVWLCDFQTPAPSDNLGINLANFRAFQVIQQDSFEHTFHVCCWIHPIVTGYVWKWWDLDQKGQNFQGLPKYFWEWFSFFISSDLISTVSRWWKCFTITMEMLHVTCYLTVFNWWKVVTQLFPFVTFCLIQIWFQPHLSQGSRNGENWQISLIFPKSFIYGI